MVSRRYAVLGAGLQGTAVAGDLARYGDAERIVLADVDRDAVVAAAARVSGADHAHLDAADPVAVAHLFEGVDVAVSCLPYWMHPGLVTPALETRTSLLDVGGDSDEALATLQRHEEAVSAGVCVVTDAGLAPGLVNAMAVLGMERFERPRTVRLYCGGLPAHPRPPLGYHAVFSLDGLVSEYRDVCYAVRGGQVVAVDPMTGLETLRWPGLGEMEAFVTSGGSGTAPWSVASKVDSYEYKTLRFPGHCRAVLELFDRTPRGEWEAAMERALEGPPDTDQVLLRVEVEGEVGGRQCVWSAQAHEAHDPAAGLTAMQRMTAFPAAIAAIEIAQGRVPRGCRSFEQAVGGTLLVQELARRGIPIKISDCR